MGAEKGKYSKHVMDFMFPYLGLTSHLYGYNGTLIILFAEPQQPGSQTPLSLESADLCNGGPGAIFSQQACPCDPPRFTEHKPLHMSYNRHSYAQLTQDLPLVINLLTYHRKHKIRFRM